MTGLEKVKETIRQETAAEQGKIQRSAEAACGRILAEAEDAAKQTEQSLAEDTARQVALMRATAESAAHKDGKNLLLSTRRALIEQAFDGALQRLQALRGPALYDTLVSVVSANAQPGEGLLLMREQDAAGLPADFVQRCCAAIPDGSVRLSPERREHDGGVIIQYGDIEINCTFAELISAAREQLEDEVNGVLFSK